ncbi:MazG-like family protein [Streptomyces xiamenensis]|uniref:MazG-like family protein n=1 Tax=Streptomyces xiamenensis TaxID=408015 RepID=UPI0036E17F0F
MDSATWATVNRLVDWLDTHSTHTPETARLLRVLKIQEEAGEVAEAIHGAMNGNPRKGQSKTWSDVEAELCDVILTGMVALATLSSDPARTFDTHLSHVAERSLPGETACTPSSTSSTTPNTPSTMSARTQAST